MEELYGRKGKFTLDDWIIWKIGNFETAINNSRTAQQLKNLSRDNLGWQKVVRDLLEEEPRKLTIDSDTSEGRLVKAGLICHAPGTADQFKFSSPAIRLLLMQTLLRPVLQCSLHLKQTNFLSKTPC